MTLRSRTKRIIACLDVRAGRVVKGVQFVGARDVGDPVELAMFYDREGADELMLLDIDASAEGRGATVDVVRRVAEAVSMPLTVGGGIRSVDDARLLFDAGADKVSIGSAAVARPQLVRECADAFGSDRIVLAIDCRRRDPGDSGAGRGDTRAEAAGIVTSGPGDASASDIAWEVVIHGGRTPTGLDVLEWSRRAQELGAGEIVLNSIDADGTKQGYDNELNRRVVSVVELPIVASGGAGTPAHLLDGFMIGGVDAVLAASMFHFNEVSIGHVKQLLRDAGVPVALPQSDS